MNLGWSNKGCLIGGHLNDRTVEERSLQQLTCRYIGNICKYL